LLPRDELEGAEPRMIGSSAVTPRVLMIGDQMRVHAGFGEHLWHRIVERPQWAPTAVQEVVAPGMQFSPGRHARHRAAVAGVELYRALGEPLHVGRVDSTGPLAR